MREKDLSEKNLFGLDDVFADFLNAFCRPKDAPRILPTELADAPTESVAEIGNGGFAHKFRDVFKCLRNKVGINLAFFGLENQTKADETMPVRVMGYDWMGYEKQTKRRNRKQKLIPIVTFVLYFGYDKRWDAPRSLRECLDICGEIEPWVVDYPIRVIELVWLSDGEIDALGSELKFIAQSLRSFRTRDFAFAPQGSTRHRDEVLTLLEHVTGEPAYAAMREKFRNEEETNMCEIMEEFRAHYRAEGFEQGERRGIEIGAMRGRRKGIEIGEKRGIEIGEERGRLEGLIAGKLESLRDMTKRIAAVMGKSPEEAMRYLQLTDEEKQQVRQAFCQ